MHHSTLDIFLLFLCALVATVTPASISDVSEDCMSEVFKFLDGDIDARPVSRQLRRMYDQSRVYQLRSLNVKLSAFHKARDTVQFLTCLDEFLESKLQLFYLSNGCKR